jgi:quaternary ammonium compound-resistance protein SugE
MGWVYLMIASVCEIGWAVGLQLSDGFTRPLPAIVTVIGLFGSIIGLSLALKTVSFGTAYVVWTGIGTVGTAAIGILAFGELASVGRILCMAAIVGGIIGLKILPATAPAETPPPEATGKPAA